jgi:hypothetical protein
MPDMSPYKGQMLWHDWWLTVISSLIPYMPCHACHVKPRGPTDICLFNKHSQANLQAKPK